LKGIGAIITGGAQITSKNKRWKCVYQKWGGGGDEKGISSRSYGKAYDRGEYGTYGRRGGGGKEAERKIEDGFESQGVLPRGRGLPGAKSKSKILTRGESGRGGGS